MLDTSRIKTLLLSSLLAAALCFAYWKYRQMDVRRSELEENRQTIEQVRQEVRDLNIRLEQTRARIEALKKDPVEEEAVARGIGRTVRSKSEKIFHLDESGVPPGAPAGAPAPAEKAPEQAAPPPAPPPAAP